MTLTPQPTLFDLAVAVPAAPAGFSAMLASLGAEPGTGWPDRFGVAIRRWVGTQPLPPLRTLSLFAGGGGLDIAFHDAGFAVAEMVELDQRFAQTITANAAPGGSLSGSNGVSTTLSLTDTESDPFYGYSIVFSPDGTKAVTASSSKTAKLWSIDGNLLTTLQHDGFVFGAMFSRDGSEILTASIDKTAKLWDIHGRLLVTMAHSAKVNVAIFSPDGNSILTGSADGTTKLWDLNGNLLVSMQHTEEVKRTVFSPDGKFILSTTSVDEVPVANYLWNTDGRLMTKLSGRGLGFFSDSSRYLVSSGNTMNSYPVQTDDLLKIASCLVDRGFTPAELQQYGISQPRFDFSKRVCPAQVSWQPK